MDVYTANANNPEAPWNDKEDNYLFRIDSQQFDDTQDGYDAAFKADELGTRMTQDEATREARNLVALYRCPVVVEAWREVDGEAYERTWSFEVRG